MGQSRVTKYEPLSPSDGGSINTTSAAVIKNTRLGVAFAARRVDVCHDDSLSMSVNAASKELGTTAAFDVTVTDCASQPAERGSFPCRRHTLYTAYTVVCVSYERYYMYGQLHVAALAVLLMLRHLCPYPYSTCLKRYAMQRSGV